MRLLVQLVGYIPGVLLVVANVSWVALVVWLVVLKYFNSNSFSALFPWPSVPRAPYACFVTSTAAVCMVVR